MSGKSILIGVYNGIAIIREYPVAFSKLVFNIVALTQKPFKKSVFEIWDREKRRVEQTMDAPEKPIQRLILHYEVRGPRFDGPTTLSIRFALDGEPVEIATFEIREAQNEEETSRLKVSA